MKTKDEICEALESQLDKLANDADQAQTWEARVAHIELSIEYLQVKMAQEAAVDLVKAIADIDGGSGAIDPEIINQINGL